MKLTKKNNKKRKISKKKGGYRNTKINTFKLVVTTYNPGNYLEVCLKSIAKQTYKNFQVCVVDDASIKSKDLINRIIHKYCKKKNWLCLFKTINEGPLKSRIDAINLLNCNDDDIIVLIDGDDMLANKKVLSILNKYYQDNIYATFGNFRHRIGNSVRFNKMVNCNINFENIAYTNSFRNSWHYSHLKTFKYLLFKEIDQELSFKKNGEYFRSATDLAIMWPILELSGNKFKCIDDHIYNYTLDHNESFHNDNLKRAKQSENHIYIQNMYKYQAIV